MTSASPISTTAHALRQILERRQRVDLVHRGRRARRRCRSASIATRRFWLKRRTRVGPWPKLMSATALSGTAPPELVGTGRFSSVDRSRRALSIRLTRIGICRSVSENFARVLRQVAERGDADRLADARDRHAELRGQVEARPDDDLRPLHVAVDARIAQLRQAAHLARPACARPVTETAGRSPAT